MTSAEPPGRLIAAGRSADVYDLGDGRVLRRHRTGDVDAREVAAMRLAAAGGYPVPSLHSANGPDMVLDRVDGADLLAEVTRRPWRAGRVGRLLAGLHERLRHIDIEHGRTGDLPVKGEPEALVHGDLHPGNVLMSDDGPAVIDWEGAFVGPADADAATFWLLVEVADVDDIPALVRPVAGMIRRRMVAAFLDRLGRPRPETVDLVCDLRLVDPNMTAVERERIAEFRVAHGTGRAPGGDAADHL